MADLIEHVPFAGVEPDMAMGFTARRVRSWAPA